MSTIHVGSELDDEARRARLHRGHLFVLAPTPGTEALCTLARAMIEEAFAPHDPTRAQFEMGVEEFVGVLGPLKPRFIHDPRTLELISQIVVEVGCDPEGTYIDVPRLRGVTSHGYLTSGVGYAHHPHRDTWYSAPLCQLNWWIPIYGFEPESSMAFHPRYWAEAVPNGSEEFNYYEWNAIGRREAAKHVRTDGRKQPRARVDLELEPMVRVVCEPAGIVLFSGAQMHSTVPNTSGLTRFSMDFRTVHLGDLRSGHGAANVDSRCHGTSLRDFVQAADRSAMPADVVERYDDVVDPEGVLVYGR